MSEERRNHWGWALASLLTAFGCFAMHAKSVPVPYLWTTHAFLILLASQWLVSARVPSEAPPELPLIRGVIFRALSGVLLAVVVLWIAIWLEKITGGDEVFEFPFSFKSWNWGPTPRSVLTLKGLGAYGTLAGLVYGPVWLVSEILSRRPRSSGRDVLGGLLALVIGGTLCAYAFIQIAHLEALWEGGRKPFRAGLQLADYLVSHEGRDLLVLSCGLAVPGAILTLARLRGMPLASRLGFCLLGTAGVVGLLSSPLCVNDRVFGRFGLIASGLFALFLPLVWAALDARGARRIERERLEG